ncbi:MAG TPA: NrfD/PsrC family molybdoenzyme membrane anchor subunit [Kofleriaceae bacterium]|nr:NrfD/PsrC family molybdoenzyme membrane anchor subunit [Kofleriaceae bacterium]
MLAPSDTYYDLPAIKPAPWSWYVPAYFYLGGLAGAAASLAGAIDLVGGRPLRGLVPRLHWIASLGEAAGGVMLVADLGRPARALNMVRVFRPTSPMNVGSWIFSAASASGGLALLGTLRGRTGPSLAGVASALAGTGLATYTGVLLGNTSVPVWKHSRRILPPWFATLSAAALGSALELGRPRGGAEARAVRVYSAVAKTAALVAGREVARTADAAGVGAALRAGRAGTMWRAAGWLGVASLAATLWPGGGRGRALVAGALGTAAGVLARIAIVEAGRASAADPRATFEPQRRAQHAGATADQA